jgi:integrase
MAAGLRVATTIYRASSSIPTRTCQLCSSPQKSQRSFLLGQSTENRITHLLRTEFGEEKLSALSLKGLQSFLNRKAASLSRSVVAHLRWDLRAIFKLAIAEGYAERDPTGALFTPKAAVTAESRSMNKEEVEHYINVLELRERVIALLAIFSGMRPGEILTLQRRHISGDCKMLSVEQRLYRET